ncbi:unnamed protein product [Polarella glacialis]|uniref:Uncharacterized protein n=1 Tax=Polarella glacialis TaxID=89957 RepID=A0A813LUU9_POLGL|nr:unnamed protein product [Polarella glacialis]
MVKGVGLAGPAAIMCEQVGHSLADVLDKAVFGVNRGRRSTGRKCRTWRKSRTSGRRRGLQPKISNWDEPRKKKTQEESFAAGALVKFLTVRVFRAGDRRELIGSREESALRMGGGRSRPVQSLSAAGSLCTRL